MPRGMMFMREQSALSGLVRHVLSPAGKPVASRTGTRFWFLLQFAGSRAAIIKARNGKLRRIADKAPMTVCAPPVANRFQSISGAAPCPKKSQRRIARFWLGVLDVVSAVYFFPALALVFAGATCTVALAISVSTACTASLVALLTCS